MGQTVAAMTHKRWIAACPLATCRAACMCPGGCVVRAVENDGWVHINLSYFVASFVRYLCDQSSGFRWSGKLGVCNRGLYKVFETLSRRAVCGRPAGRVRCVPAPRSCVWACRMWGPGGLHHMFHAYGFNWCVLHTVLEGGRTLYLHPEAHGRCA